MENKYVKRIVVDPEIMAGKPVIKGTRIPVDLIIKLLGEGMKQEDILEGYPSLAEDDIKASLLYGASVVSSEYVFPTIIKHKPGNAKAKVFD
jgi:uncharacterized protein (DUF433 family)